MEVENAEEVISVPSMEPANRTENENNGEKVPRQEKAEEKIDSPNVESESAVIDVEDNAHNAGDSNTVESQAIQGKDENMEAAYSYTKRSHEFTSEIFKIEVGNLPKFFGYKV